MKQYNFQTGRKGEAIAEEYLRKKHLQIIDRNFRTRYGEIDLVALEGEWLVFVEVKLKVGDRFGMPEEMISCRKVQQVMRTAEAFMLEKKEIARRYTKYRVDVVAVVIGDGGEILRITHYENAGSEVV